MTEEQVKERIAKNLAHYRKLSGLTQIELSSIINYSDKSVSKWERGEGVPDIFVLTKLAELFGISVGDFLSEEQKHRPTSQGQKMMITLMSVGLVWFVATLSFIVCKIAIPTATYLWMAYIIAIPVSAIVLIVFSCIWWNLLSRFLSVSLLLWGLALTFHLPLRVENIALVYVLAGVFQVLVVLWYVLMHMRRHGGRRLFKKLAKPEKAEQPPAADAEEKEAAPSDAAN